MKKQKNSIFAVLVLLAVFLVSPIFTACQQKITLNAPTIIELQNDEYGQKLICDYNTYASGYIFGICDSTYEEGDYSNFIQYKTEKCFLDVTNIFKDPKNYYYYAVAVGTGNYITSEKSEVKTYENLFKLNCPELVINGNKLSWSQISNGSSYRIMCNDVFVADVSSNEYDITTYVNSQVSANKFEVLNFKVYAKQTGNYLRSADSNLVTYTSHLILSNPTNVALSASKTLSWTAIPHALSYTVLINGTEEIVANSNSISVASYFVNGGAYSFQVKANANGNFIQSGYSTELTYDYYVTLSAPTDLTTTINGSYVEISWTEVANAGNYSLYINDVLFDDSISTNGVTISFSKLGVSSVSELTDKMAKVKSNAYGYYKESFFSTSIKLYNTTLAVPSISLNEQTKTISWLNSANVGYYAVSVGGTDYTTDISIENGSCTYNFASKLVEAKKYTIYVKAYSVDTITCVYSNEVQFDNYVKLAQPVISGVARDGEYFVVNFSVVQNAINYSVYVNGSLKSYQSSPNLGTVYVLVRDCNPSDWYDFTIKAIGTNYYLDSDLSTAVGFSGYNALAVPTNVRMVGDTLMWNSVTNATGYKIAINKNVYTSNSTATTLSLPSMLSEDNVYSLKVSAFGGIGTIASGYSTNDCYYNYTTNNALGYTDKYFFFGDNYHDYYMSTIEECYDLVNYSLYNFISPIVAYIGFDYGTKLELVNNVQSNMKMQTYRTSKIAYSLPEASSVLTLTWELTQPNITGTDYTAEWEESESIILSTTTSNRDESYNGFVSETSLVSQKVYSSNGLLSAIENWAKPDFASNGLEAYTIYNKAKQILREIINDSMTDYEKALAINDYLCLNVSYDDSCLNSDAGYLFRAHYLEGSIIDGIAVCDGYAKAFSLLCNMEGIKTINIGGEVGSGGGHAWNKIYLQTPSNNNYAWYTVDSTWNDGTVSSLDREVLMHKYFMIPDSYISDRTEDWTVDASTSSAGLYYDNIKLGDADLRIDTREDRLAFEIAFNKSSLNQIEILISLSQSSYLSSIYQRDYYTYNFESGYYVGIITK